MDYSKKTCKQLQQLCKQHKIKGYHGKRKQELLKLLQQKTNSPYQPTRSDNMSCPDWYKIQEIPYLDYITCCKPIYDVLEDRHISKSAEDPFLKASMTGMYSMSESDYVKWEVIRQKQKALEMKWGDFHEELMGKFPDYETLPTGHESGCDVQKRDETEIFEIKNRDNTVKGSDGKHIISMLKRHRDAGKRAIFVQVNCPDGKVKRYNAPPEIEVWNGRQAYAHLSGRDTFFDDLLSTVKTTFSLFKTYDSLKQTLEIA